MAERLQGKTASLDPKVLNVDINTLLYQVPGGMLSNLINQLKQAGKERQAITTCSPEVPRVREDFGYPPLVTPSSQIVGTQAVHERHLRRALQDTSRRNPVPCCAASTASLPGPVNEEVRAQGRHRATEDVITCRPADLIEPELPKYREQSARASPAARRTCSPYALFPQVAEKFIKLRNTRHPLGQRFIKPLEHAEKVERHIAPLSRKK